MVRDRFQVGEWAVVPRLSSIVFNGKTVRLEPRLMQVLVCLAAADGDVVTKDELVRQVWSSTLVNDDVLKRSIAELRRAFDDDPKNPSFIETIPNFGYRLVAPVDLTTTSSLRARRGMARRLHARWPLFSAVALVLVALAVLTTAWLTKSRIVRPPRLLPFTAMNGFEGNPSFSPDGRQVAFDHAADAGTESNIYVQALGGEKAAPLTSGPGPSGCPAWSPDGKAIAFTRRWETRPGSLAASLALISPLGGSHQDLTPVSARGSCVVSWSPGSHRLAFSHQPSDGAAGIFVIAVAERTIDRLSTAPTGSGDEDPAFSPDGALVAFARSFGSETRDLYVVKPDGTELRRVTSLNANLGGPVWEADGKHLLFWRRAQTSAWGSGLYRVSTSGGTPERLFLGSNDASHPALSLKTGRLAFVKNVLDVNIWKVPAPEKMAANKNLPVRLDSSARVDTSPAFSPDGQRVAFVSDRDGSLAIWIGNPDGSNAAKVTDVQTGTSLAWSPDSSEIVYDSQTEGRSHVYVVNPVTKGVRQVTQSSYGDAVPSWSADGKWIYFASLRSGQWNIWKVPSAEGEPVQVTTNRGVHPVEAPGGKYLYYAKPADPAAPNSTAEVPGIWRVSTSGGMEELVLAPPTAPDGGYWTVGQKGIYFVSTAERSQATLKLFSFATRRVDRIASLEKYPWGGAGLAVSPDGLTILYSQVDAAGSDIVVAEGYR